jgi:hypothetical protein
VTVAAAKEIGGDGRLRRLDVVTKVHIETDTLLAQVDLAARDARDFPEIVDKAHEALALASDHGQPFDYARRQRLPPPFAPFAEPERFHQFFILRRDVASTQQAPRPLVARPAHGEGKPARLGVFIKSIVLM